MPNHGQAPGFEQALRRAKAERDRQHHMRLLSTLAFYLQKGGSDTLGQQHPGDGSGVPHGHIRFIIEFESPLFWRTYGELEKRRARQRDRTR